MNNFFTPLIYLECIFHKTITLNLKNMLIILMIYIYYNITPNMYDYHANNTRCITNYDKILVTNVINGP